MKDWSSMPFVGCFFWTCRLALSAAFIYAGVLKINAPQEFADSLASYQLLPDSMVNILALGLPLFELACGLSLLTVPFCRIGLLSIISLLTIFFVALVSTILRGLSIDCGCFGADSWLDSNPWIALLRDVLLLFVAIYAYRYYVKRNDLSPAPNRE